MTTTPSVDDPATNPPDETLALLAAQSALYTELESLAKRQRSLISHADTGPLLALLADRQKLSNQMTRIAERLEPIRRDWDHYRERLSQPQRGRAEKLLAETRQRLRRVIERDEEDARLLSARKQAAAHALHTTHSAGQAMHAYRAGSVHAGCLDRLDEDPS